MKPRVVPLVALMAGLVAVAFVSIGIYTPSMPAIEMYFAASSAEVQLTFSAYIIAFAVGQLLYGPVSDRFGRKPALYLGLVIYILGSVVCLAAPNIETLILGRGVQAFGGCAGPVVIRAILRDLFSRDEGARLFSFIGLAMGLAPAFAPVIGGLLQVTFGWQSIFVLLTVAGGVMLVLVILFLQESNRSPVRSAPLLAGFVSDYPRIIRSIPFIGYTLNIGAAMAALFVYIAGAPFVLINMLGVPPDRFGWFVVIPTVFNLLGAAVASQLTLRLGGDRMVYLGTGFVTAGGAILLFSAYVFEPSVAAIVGPMCFASFGLSLLFPSSAQGAVSLFPDRAGAASSLNGFLQMLIVAAATIVVGLMGTGTQFPMVYGVAASAVLCALSLVLIVPFARPPPGSRGD
jgi:DHA1 family bicyclomycin/chloramphenicol resistance-like MFS transporter